MMQLSNHNALAAGGRQAGAIASEFWFMFITVSAVFVVVYVAALWAFSRGRGRAAPLVDRETQNLLRSWVGGAVGVTAIILITFMVLDFTTGRHVEAFSTDPKHALTVHVIGHQWWWEFRYEDSVPARAIGATNELHIPTGRPVLLKLESHDVIHSFWIPGLQGKRDLIPGYNTMMWLRADKPGVYEGQCAEYCGYEHAKMRLTVVADHPDDFASWYSQAMRPATNPTDSLALRGQEVFLAAPCAVCHTIRGTPAGGRLGPDLTHLASQRRIAANTYPNTKGYLAAWISDAQTLKPGVRMPPISIPAKDMEALLAYLGTLK